MITIDYKDRKPIYEQLIDNIKDLIVKGILIRDDQLPSVRQLANDLAINPNTIQKAYSELERQGIIYSLKGRGSFVASHVAELREAQKSVFMDDFRRTLYSLIQLGVKEAEINDEVKGCYKAEEEGGHSRD